MCEGRVSSNDDFVPPTLPQADSSPILAAVPLPQPQPPPLPPPQPLPEPFPPQPQPQPQPPMGELEQGYYIHESQIMTLITGFGTLRRRLL